MYVTKINGRTTEPSKDGLRPRVTVELADDLGFFNKQIGLIIDGTWTWENAYT